MMFSLEVEYSSMPKSTDHKRSIYGKPEFISFADRGMASALNSLVFYGGMDGVIWCVSITHAVPFEPTLW